jgi:hypothetical protein
VSQAGLRRVFSSWPLAARLHVVALDRFLEAERRLIDRPRVLLDIAKTPLHGVGAAVRRTTQSPRRPYGAGGGQRSEPIEKALHPLSTIHAPFPTEVECKMPSVADLRLSRMGPFAREDRLLKSSLELQNRNQQLAREESPPPGLRRPRAKLSRNSNQVARGRIRQFESDIPSHAVGSRRETTSEPSCMNALIFATDSRRTVPRDWT